MTAAHLEELGLLAPADLVWEAPDSPLRVSRRRSAKASWPDYARVLEGAPLAHNSNNPDVSSNARENGEHYALTTAQRAADAAKRRERNP